MNAVSRVTLALAGLLLAAHASAQVTLYERDGFQGRSFTTQREVWNLERLGFNDRASSVVVNGRRWERWEVCDERGFRGRCVVLRPGEYSSLAAMGLNDQVSSVRAVDRNTRVDDERYAPPPPPVESAQSAQITLYADENFRGRSMTAEAPLADFRDAGFNDRASSLVVRSGRWEVCDSAGFNGRCVVLSRGDYASLSALGMNDRISSVRSVGRDAVPPVVAPVGQVDLYEDEGFRGQSFSANATVDNFRRSGFNDSASSAVVSGGRWEVCSDVGFTGRCVVLRPGQYPSLASMELNDRISSVRSVAAGVRLDEGRPTPLPVVSSDYRRRNNERLFEAPVTSVRAVVDDSGRQCWVEPDRVSNERGAANVPGALLGAVVGGILGHQVGGGSGRDVATGIGVLAGAAVGANVGRRDGSQQVVTTSDVQRCDRTSAQTRPTYWDVTYTFASREYRVQMNRPPGTTVTVNEQGEPRG